MAHPHSAEPMAHGDRDVLERTAPPPARTTAYGADPAQVYDVRLPAGHAAGDDRVVVVHGGFWRERFDRAHAACQAQAFADAGYPVAVVEYRRTGMPGGGWPGTVRRRARRPWPRCAPTPTCPDRLVLVGHSAGRAPRGLGRQPAVGRTAWPAWSSLAGCVDLAGAHAQRLGDGAVEAFMGGAPEDAAGGVCRGRPGAAVPSGAGRPGARGRRRRGAGGGLPVLRRPHGRGRRDRGHPARGGGVRALRAHRPGAPGLRRGPRCGRPTRLLGWAT